MAMEFPIKKHNKFVVFLDVDGVLNSRTTVKKSPDGYKGIDSARVLLLANVINKYGGADIVLSSDWKEMKSTDDDYVYLVSKLNEYGLEISGHTKDIRHNRGEGIMEYLNEHQEIEEFVVLDDCTFDFEDYRKIWERLLITDGLERAKFASKTPAVEAIIFMDYLKMF